MKTEYLKIVRLFMNNNGFLYPCCGSHIVDLPTIENENSNDSKVQIYCPYCRQFIYLNDYLPKNI